MLSKRRKEERKVVYLGRKRLLKCTLRLQKSSVTRHAKDHRQLKLVSVVLPLNLLLAQLYVSSLKHTNQEMQLSKFYH